MIWSGWLIYWAHQPYGKIPDDLGPIQIHHKLAEGMGWHFFIMWLLIFNGIVYLGLLITTGGYKELLPRTQDFKTFFPYLLYDLRLISHGPVIEGKFNPVQKLSYFGIIIIGTMSILSGLAMYKPIQLPWLVTVLGGYRAARLEHFLCMSAFVLFIPIHIIQVLRAGWNNLRAMIAGYEIET
jgi:thiosulfate reductase cytochrome b subunit